MTSILLNQILEVNIQKINGLAERLTPENSLNRINPATGTAGFYMRHIAEAQILLCKLLFEANVDLAEPQTMRVPNDDGRFYDILETKQLLELGYETLKNVVNTYSDEAWNISKTTFFGELTAIKGFARILNHSAHHCGQIELALKKGQQFLD